jgi:peptidyl-prolyl cis-trans isomerase B (cyclophilin B)
MRALVLALVLALVVAAGCGSDDGNGETTAAGDGQCESVETPSARGAESREAPTEALASGTSYALVLETSCGSFTVGLDLESAPKTAASLVALAGDGYFDDTIFHRVVPGFVIQGGDPTQSGAGGPGYQTVDVPARTAQYARGVFAMAKSPDEAAGTAGSQFFVVTGDEVVLPPDYAIAGEVTEGLDTVDRIGALGVGDGPPSQTVLLRSVTVSES